MASALPARRGGRALDSPSAHHSRGTVAIWSAPARPATADPVQAGPHCQERAADAAPKPKNRALASGFDKPVRTGVRAAPSTATTKEPCDAFRVAPGTTPRPSAATP